MRDDHKSSAGFRPEIFANEAVKQSKKTGLPPVHLWNPEFCGDIDMHIKRDGGWNYMGTPITRPAMVKLFSTILRCDDGKYYLVTPVEKVGIRVDDAPFVVVEMDYAKDKITFHTNVDDEVTVSKVNPIRVVVDEVTGEPSPYARVRDNLDALICRSVFYQLVEHSIEQNGRHGVVSCGEFFPLD
jgi:uncharacterized protein